jgi:hypothetical protein
MSIRISGSKVWDRIGIEACVRTGTDSVLVNDQPERLGCGKSSCEFRSKSEVASPERDRLGNDFVLPTIFQSWGGT